MRQAALILPSQPASSAHDSLFTVASPIAAFHLMIHMCCHFCRFESILFLFSEHPFDGATSHTLPHLLKPEFRTSRSAGWLLPLPLTVPLPSFLCFFVLWCAVGDWVNIDNNVYQIKKVRLLFTQMTNISGHPAYFSNADLHTKVRSIAFSCFPGPALPPNRLRSATPGPRGS